MSLYTNPRSNMLLPNCDFRDLGRAIQQPAQRPIEPTVQDDRNSHQRRTHCNAVVATDPGMSGWGKAEGGLSVCAWACGPGVDPARVLAWVEGRSDMSDPQVVDLDEWTPPDGTAHVHIYICNQGHAATVEGSK